MCFLCFQANLILVPFPADRKQVLPMYDYRYYYYPQQQLQECNVYTGICQSFCSRGFLWYQVPSRGWVSLASGPLGANWVQSCIQVGTKDVCIWGGYLGCILFTPPHIFVEALRMRMSMRKSMVYSCTMRCESWTITFPKELVKCLFFL